MNNFTNIWMTGHSGFLGKSLVKKLKKENNIFKISRNDLIEKNKFLNNRINFNNIDDEFKKKFKNNHLYHLATYYNKNVYQNDEAYKVIESNLIFGLRLINSFGINFFEKILLTQSYMELKNETNLNLYSLTKKIFANEVNKQKSNNLIKIYLYDTFGLSDKRGKLINIWLGKMMRNESIEIFDEKKYINLSSDAFFSKIISNCKHLKSGNYELKTKVELTLLELFDLLREITKSKSEKIVKEDYKIEMHTKYDNICDVLNIHYKIDNFKEDIISIINKEFNY